MRSLRSLPLCLTALAFDCGANPNILVVNDFGDAGPGNCTSTCTLRDAIPVALAAVPVKSISFSAVGGSPQTIALAQGQLVINNTSGSELLIVGPGTDKLAISAGNLSRALQVSGGSVDIVALTIRDGRVAGTSPGTEPANSGNPGQGGGTALGGCIAVDEGATLTLELSDIRNCAAQGGTGGNGGSGDPNGGTGGVGGMGGIGGGGGSASGGAIYSAGALSLLRSSVVNASAAGGPGGNGGNGGSGTFGDGAGGNAGPAGSAAGAGVAIAASGSLLIRNTTLAGATATGGDGGIGGNGGFFSPSGNGGTGGNVTGGVLYVASLVLADLEFATLANGTAVAGDGGPPGSTGSTLGLGGLPGVARGAGVYSTGPNSVIFSSSVIVGSGGASLCFGSVGVDPGSVNLDQDSSCTGFTLHDTFAHVLMPLNLATTSWPGYEPVFHSAIVDAAAGCVQIGGVVAVTNDQHGTARPQGAKCDLGAIESDHVFANGFE